VCKIRGGGNYESKYGTNTVQIRYKYGIFLCYFLNTFSSILPILSVWPWLLPTYKCGTDSSLFCVVISCYILLYAVICWYTLLQVIYYCIFLYILVCCYTLLYMLYVVVRCYMLLYVVMLYVVVLLYLVICFYVIYFYVICCCILLYVVIYSYMLLYVVICCYVLLYVVMFCYFRLFLSTEKIMYLRLLIIFKYSV
jgi:hypothetical protein